MKKIAVVGNRSFPITVPIATAVVDVLLEYGPDVLFLTRGSEGFEEFLLRALPLIDRRCFAYPSKGGPDNFLRDIELVKDADEVIAFLDPKTLSDPTTGAAHVVEKALDQKKPVRAYSTDGEGLVYVGAS